MPRVTLLLGAGASVEAGLPTMAGVLESFARSVEDEPRLASALSCVIASLRSHSEAARHRPVLDLELLIEALEFLEQRDASIAAAFVRQWRGDISKHLAVVPELRRRLHAHLRNQLDVDPSRVKYLMPLVDFAREQGGVDVFTLNYDAAVEVVADRAGVLYTDGFDSHWNPSLFDQADRYPIRLYKLHGSLLWYETGSPGRFAKIALRPRGFPESGSHIAGESLASLLIYPGPSKEMYAEPYASLLERFRSVLRDTSVLVVIGCSLRDAHVRQAVLEAMSCIQGVPRSSNRSMRPGKSSHLPIASVRRWTAVPAVSGPVDPRASCGPVRLLPSGCRCAPWQDVARSRKQQGEFDRVQAD